ncbi:hypothetical protein ABBQ32_011934 [Trebouxia sp. C0010 RCD-2024]
MRVITLGMVFRAGQVSITGLSYAMPSRRRLVVSIAYTCCVLITTAAPQPDLPNTTYSGYVSTNGSDGSKLFYAYYEAHEARDQDPSAPLLLWLQGGPGCASMFGNFYELGPYWVNESLRLSPNPGTWNRRFGLLFIDQPAGSGFSIAGSLGIPTDEMQIATDLYAGLQHFFSRHTDLQARPLFITGESYAGKYVPAIGHYILQMEQVRTCAPPQPLLKTRAMSVTAQQLGPPLFKLAGLAIGNGLTDPALQVLTHADTCHYMSLIDQHEKMHAMELQLQVAAMISQGQWKEASRHRAMLMAYLQHETGVGTLLDTRRTRDYDPDNLVDQYLNLEEVQEALGVKPGTKFEGCSERVAEALGPDVMKSVKDLIPDLLAALPVLLYQGQFDAQDGPGSVEAWTTCLDWPGKADFFRAKRHIWRMGQDTTGFLQDAPGMASNTSQAGSRIAEGILQLAQQADSGKVQPVAGYWKHHQFLTTMVLKDAGHMVPRDQPLVAQHMIETWVQHSLDHNSQQLIKITAH